ncbi:MAG TPA: DNA repair protein RadC [Chitinophagaceae bacterium]|nr:MAG: DNA repair protein RadC [Bacteroidetes bacterium OLB11]HMN32245.1 DNA repair protein RadC [Chitinophagaceae bacterium]
MNNEFKKIKDWALDERPREKMIEKGASALSNSELIAILINTGTAQRTALDISKEILQINQNNLLEFSKMGLNELLKIKGLGEKKAVTLLAALELGKRRQLAVALENPVISSSREAYNILAPYYLENNHETFYVIYMLHNGKIVMIEPISNGGITGTVVDIRIIFRKALELKTVTRLIISHNHPSGNLNPSEADKQLTRKIKEAGKLFDIAVNDHIIVAGDHYFSFADQGIL